MCGMIKYQDLESPCLVVPLHSQGSSRAAAGRSNPIHTYLDGQTGRQADRLDRALSENRGFNYPGLSQSSILSPFCAFTFVITLTLGMGSQSFSDSQ